MFKLTGILLISIASSQAFTSFYFVIMDYVAAVLCRVNVDFQLKSFLLKPGLPLYQRWICLVHWTRVSILIFLSPLPFSHHWENHHFHRDCVTIIGTWPIDHHHNHHFNQATNPVVGKRRAGRLGNRGEARTRGLQTQTGANPSWCRLRVSFFPHPTSRSKWVGETDWLVQTIPITRVSNGSGEVYWV